MSDDEQACRAKHPSNIKGAEVNGKRAKELKDAGRCGSLTAGWVYVCTLMAHGPDTNHQEQVLGGINDGLIAAEWEW